MKVVNNFRMETTSYMIDNDGYLSLFFFDKDRRLVGKNTHVLGLHYFPNIISSDFETKLWSFLEKESWWNVGKSSTSRQVIHYGYKYNYLSGGVADPAPSFPPLIRILVKEILFTGVIPEDQLINQCIVNKYLPGQGIGAHIDSSKYGDFISCFTIGGGTEIEFKKGDEIQKLYTEPRSLYIMSGYSRYEWTHCIRPKKTDIIPKDQVKIPRSTRISLTFRSVPL